jgi:hypothetical protein
LTPATGRALLHRPVPIDRPDERLPAPRLPPRAAGASFPWNPALMHRLSGAPHPD